ncbi:hypothetical protein IU459_01860 [Nocardia amamiensis]|uniref:Tail assembly chaperone E/41/14-like protein n=1 Tax=Nocardia amamiensis TaxID=404578 RepID=A0ABS0CI42_9NOCA|nr:hypothetical protein [Nocardia amamiensis]MBF6296286.1 hypothetical protein [Nocardia amamiensis]
MASPKVPNTIDEITRVKEDFVHRIGDVEVRLPSLSYLKPGFIRRIRRMNSVDAMYTLIEMSASPAALAVLDDMDPTEYQALLDEWRAHSGVGLGES